MTEHRLTQTAQQRFLMDGTPRLVSNPQGATTDSGPTPLPLSEPAAAALRKIWNFFIDRNQAMLAPQGDGTCEDA